jgi:LysM domain
MSVPTTLSTHNRVADVGRGLLALVGAAVVVVGVPAALLWWVGSPLPAEMPSLSEITDALRDTYIPDEFLVKALALVCWVVWVELVASLLVEAVAYARGRKAGSVPLAGGLQRGAARLVATVALLGVLFATRGMHDDRPGQPLAPVSPPAVSFVTDLERAGGQQDMHPDAPAPAPAEAPTYSVQRRDTLWDIAERHLGDPFRWREIFDLNQGRPQADGRCLTDPDLIYAGWRLELPADATGLTPAAAPASGGAPTAQPTAAAPDGAPGSALAPGADASNRSGGGDGGMVLIDDGDKASGGVARDDAVLVSGANGPTRAFDGMVLLPPTSPADDPSDPALAGPDEGGADELASPAEAAADRRSRSRPD